MLNEVKEMGTERRFLLVVLLVVCFCAWMAKAAIIQIGLTAEVVERLENKRPANLGEAKKLSGITPAALINLHIYLKIRQKNPKL